MEAWGGAWGLRFIHHFLQASLWAGGFLTTGLEMNWSCHPEPARARLAAAAGVAVAGSLGFPLRCFGVALVRFPDTSSWVLCLDVGGLDVVRSPRVSFQKRWLLGSGGTERGEVWRGCCVNRLRCGQFALSCSAALAWCSPPTPAHRWVKGRLFLPASDWRPGGFPGASVSGCRPHFQSRFCRGPGELPGPRPHCSSLGASRLGASPLCCQGPSRLCPSRSCAEAAFGCCGGAGPLTQLLL